MSKWATHLHEIRKYNKTITRNTRCSNKYWLWVYDTNKMAIIIPMNNFLKKSLKKSPYLYHSSWAPTPSGPPGGHWQVTPLEIVIVPLIRVSDFKQYSYCVGCQSVSLSRNCTLLVLSIEYPISWSWYSFSEPKWYRPTNNRVARLHRVEKLRNMKRRAFQLHVRFLEPMLL